MSDRQHDPIEREPGRTAPGGEDAGEHAAVPHQSYGEVFLRFLRFGFLAWGGPVAQIDMIRHELVTEERWVSHEHFRRLLGIYQVLPGPEAHELCVHFGTMARGRLGGVLAGLGFMLPGFVLMFVLSWLYLRFQLNTTAFQAIFFGIQPAVIALIVRACHRIEQHALVDRALWVIAVFAAAGQFFNVPFWFTLALAGVGYLVWCRRSRVMSAALVVVFAIGVMVMSPVIKNGGLSLSADEKVQVPESSHRVEPGSARPETLLVSGFRAGLLTFGGAYTAIPFLEQDAVQRGGWMTRRDFLDGVALSGILPAPLIIFSTFVGFYGGGPLGALAMTFGVFLPAFSFTLLFYRRLQAVLENLQLKHFLEGVTAGVVGMIAVTAVELAWAAIPNLSALGIFLVSGLIVYRWKSKWVTPVLIAVGGVAGALLFG